MLQGVSTRTPPRAPMQEPDDPPLDPTGPRMRALGFLLDSDNRWLHPRLQLVAPDPDALLSAEPGQLAAFFDPDLWLEPHQLTPPDPLPDRLARLTRELGLRWCPWALAWETPGGALLSAADLTRLGEVGLLAAVARLRAWRAEQPRRRLAAVMGMGAMALWTLAGWTAGGDVWLGGMLLIAALSWWMRPQREPEDLWRASADPERAQRALQTAREALGPAWAEVAEGVGAASADGRTLTLLHLGLSVETTHLTTRLTPAGALAILECVVPEPPEEAEAEE